MKSQTGPRSAKASGLEDPVTGRLERPVVENKLLVSPEVRLDGERLVWSPYGGKIRQVTPGPGMFERFLGLSDAPAKKILGYAKRWGVLEVCIHDLPAKHDGVCEQLRPVDSEERDFWEPLATWRRIAVHARALISVAVKLEDETGPGSKEERAMLRQQPAQMKEEEAILSEWCPVDLAPFLSNRVRRGMLVLAVNNWLDMGGVRPALSWPGWHFELRSRGLYGALGIQLMMAIASSDGFALCSGCGAVFSPEKHPAVGKRRFCEECREKGIPMKLASRDYWRRQHPPVTKKVKPRKAKKKSPKGGRAK